MNNLYQHACNITRCLLRKNKSITPATNIMLSLADVKRRKSYYYCEWADNVMVELYGKCCRNEFAEEDYKVLDKINKEIESVALNDKFDL